MPNSRDARLPFDASVLRAPKGAPWRDWQIDPEAARPKVSLDALDPGAKPFSGGDKAADKEAVERLAGEIDALQNVFHPDRRYKLLVVL
ncbi:MAG: polyphosphate--nucleotide phosphotransferase, partial [Pseudomonas stutzeri]|nr:polyphosphate--nucleotide phosphotransferase [Stutzerimonas stutzeri]